ncbi:MAG: hypothetical protein HOC71_17960 [Candidatus Latescibacteria bacterium]|jgi:hypothetical protein|nr:hypothetical protein [Candidatus Latescibacterota bacterium]
MRRSLVCLTAAILLLSGTPALALFGFGIHGGIDNITVESFDSSFKLGDGNMVSLKRDEISSPVMFGCNFLFDALPIIDFEVSADACLQDYSLSYTTPLKTEQLDATFGRVGLYGTVRKNLISFPPLMNVLSLYTGAGVGLHLITPVVGKNLIQEELKTMGEPLKPDDIAGKLTRVGGHILLGAQFKPILIPLMVKADAKYTLLGDGDYEEPGSFLSVYVSLGMKF